MALFSRGESTSDMNPQITRWGKLALIGLGVLLLGALIVGTFIYGSRQVDDTPAVQTEETAPATESATPTPQQAENSTINSTPSQTPSAQSVAPTPTTGPQAVPVTGAEDLVPYITTALALLGWHLYRSRKQLRQVQRNL